MKDVIGFLKQQQSKSSSPELATEWHTLEELYCKKLWHQLTLKLTDFVQNPCFAAGEGLIKLYENFLSDFEHRINPLSLMEIILHVARQMTDPNVAISFLEKTREKLYENFLSDFEHRINPLSLMEIILHVARQMTAFQICDLFQVKSSDEAVILCKTTIGSLKLEINDLPATKVKSSDEAVILCKTTIGSLKLEINDLPATKLMHPVLESLRSTDKQWLIDTLYAFNSGNVETFQSFKTAWGQQPDLAAKESSLMQKIQLLCLMEMTFTRPANHRQLTFQEIALSAKVPVSEVELLVMKALSVGLIKGNIDEVDQRVHMTWVQPRVLDLQQIKGMNDRLDLWCGDVKNTAMLVEHQAHDILT
ncbi:UNVERIFIED_CONTAM: hypothetical protein FKN15_019343 [Acipenser sinensis]